MKNLKFFALAIAIIGFSSTLFAQNTYQTLIQVNATIGATITISKSTDLKFGNIIAGSTAGTVTVPLTGSTRAISGGVTLPSIAGEVSAAQFTVTGFSNATYNIIMPEDNVVTLANGSNTMKLKTFTNNANKILTGGTETFKVGATLQVGANQASGTYTASFNVSVAYN